MENRCLGTTLDVFTQLLLLGQSALGRILIAYVFSASLAGSYLSRHELTEAQEFGAALFGTIILIVVGVALNIGTVTAITTCMP